MQWDYAIDAGSAVMRLCSRTQLELYRESSLTAQRVSKETPFAWGDRAYEIYGREPEGIFIRRAVKAGLPNDVPLLAKWVRRLTDDGDKRALRRASVLIALAPSVHPDTVMELERCLLEEEVEEYSFVSSDFACAVGAGKQPLDAEGTLIVDFGAAHITATLYAGGRVVRTETLNAGVDAIDEAIMRAAREQLGCAVGPHTAQKIRMDLASAEGMSGEVMCAHPAYDFDSSLPRVREFSAAMVNACVDEVVNKLTEALTHMISFAPVGLAEDLCRHGIALAGGGANLFGLDRRLERALGVPVRAAEKPEECVIRGLQTMLNQPELYQLLVYGGAAEKRHA